MDESKYEKELRIGLVLYGGVSLAIYIYGVVYEFLRLVREEGLYARLIKQARVKPVIDIISGSSAGGINGLFLAKALTTGGDLAPLKELWIQKGDLEALVNSDSKVPLSLLNSEYYETQLREALSQVKAGPNAKHSNNLLDLFITTTNLDGIVTEYGDPYFRSPIQTKHYGTVFHFKARPGHYDLSELLQLGDPKSVAQDTSELLAKLMETLQQERRGHNDFDPDDQQIDPETGQGKNYYLARVAASTSAFPVAFSPVSFKKEEIAAIKRLFRSEVFETNASGLGMQPGETNQAMVYGDGGMVQNKPFSQTLRTIFHRQADVPVDRKLFFIEPDPVTLDQENRLADRDSVDGIHSLLGFFEATFYESISADLEALIERNMRIQEVQGLLTDFEAVLAKYLKQHHAAGHGSHTGNANRKMYQMQPVYPTYRQLKIKLLRRELEERILGRADINSLISEAAEEFPEDVAPSGRPDKEIYMQNRLKEILNAVIQNEYGLFRTDDEASRFLRRFDYPFRIRRLRYFINKLNDWLTEIDLMPEIDSDSDAVKALVKTLGTLKGKIYAFIEFYNHGAWLIWDQVPPIVKIEDLPSTFAFVSVGYDKLMDSAYKQLAFDMIGSDLTQAIKHLDQLRPQSPFQAENNQYYEIREKTAYLENILRECADQDLIGCMEELFNIYEFLDMYLYPASILADIGEADPIEVIRVSPKDATRYRATVAEKLAGEKLMHFSAFLKKSWRENDLLWGRLDAAEIIVRSLLQNDKAEADKILDELSPAIIAEELISIRERREVEISQVFFTEREQAQIKEILKEQATLKGVEDIEKYLQQYTTGQQSFESISQNYILRLTAKSLRTVSRMFQRRSEQYRETTNSALNRPMQYLSALLNLPYIFLITLGGAEEAQRKRLINYAVILATTLLVLHLIGGIRAESWLLVGIIGLIVIYLQPKQRFGIGLLIIAIVLLLLSLLSLSIAAGIFTIEVCSPWPECAFNLIGELF